jgi:hypothetical protein
VSVDQRMVLQKPLHPGNTGGHPDILSVLTAARTA